MPWRTSFAAAAAAAIVAPLPLSASPTPGVSPALSPSPTASAGVPSPSVSASAPAPPATSPAPTEAPGIPGLPSEPPRFNPQLEWPLVTLGADALWTRGLGAGVKVAVVDTGINLQQPDLAHAVSSDEDLLPVPQQDNGLDVSDDSHGTAVAGIIAARGSPTNPDQMAGLAPQASLLDVRVAAEPGPVPPSLAAQGIRDAALEGARVINVSLPVAFPSRSLQAAVSFAEARDSVVVASAGSTGAPQALANYPGVLVVGAVNRKGRPALPPALGPVTVYAPGTDLFSTAEVSGEGLSVGGYVSRLYGSGYAAAYASGAIALLLSADSGLSPAEAGRLLTQAARSVNAHPGPGFIDPAAALTLALATPTPSPSPSPSTLPPGATGAHGGPPQLSFFFLLAAVALVLVLAAALVAWRRRPASGAGPLPDHEPSSWDQPWW
jgi:Subtilase family